MIVRASPFTPLVVLSVVYCAVVACSSDAGNRTFLVSAGGGPSAGERGASSSAGDGGTGNPESGAAGEAGRSSNGGLGEAEAGAGAVGNGEPPVAPSACSQKAVWSGASEVDLVSSAASETLLSVTADELDFAFLRGSVLYLAHRPQVGAAFVIGAPVVIPDGWSTARGAALSPDGKRLLLVSDPDQKKLGEMTRVSRDAAFTGKVDESAFNAVNQDAVYTGKLYASPVVSPTDEQLFFNSSFPDGASTVVVATSTAGAAWSAPLQLTPLLLDGAASSRRLPSGVSADERTLFYFNEQTMTEEARFRDAPSRSSALYDLVSLGMRRGATPNTACDRLYSALGGEVVVETH